MFEKLGLIIASESFLSGADKILALSSFKVVKEIMKKTVLALTAALGLLHHSAHAVEVSGQIHAGEESGSMGYQFTVSDSFDNQGKYRWAIAYSYLDELEATWVVFK